MSALATVTSHQPDRDEHDFYVEPPEAVEALLSVEPFSGSIWDPACGQGTIPATLRRSGHPTHEVLGSDIVMRGTPLSPVYYFQKIDFIGDYRPITVVANIITNPPFKLLEPFIERAMLTVTHKAAFLVRLSALEGMKRHERIFAKHPLARIHVFKNRISMPPGGRGIEVKGGAVAFCWWVFDKSHQGPPTVHWIKAERPDK